MPSREQRHPPRPREHPRRYRALLRWLPEFLVLALVAAAFAVQGFDLSGRLFGAHEPPVPVPPPAGLHLPGQALAAPVAPTFVRPAGSSVSAAAVRRALGGLVSDPALGAHPLIAVDDLDSGRSVYAHGTGTVMPASTMKLLTTTAALHVLGPMRRFSTRVLVQGHRITLVGGGDPFLMSDQKAARGLYPERADLDTLAVRTAQALHARGVTAARLRYDAGLFTGPPDSPDWPASYLSQDVVPPISALWTDEGQDRHGRYVADPAATAGAAFAKALHRHGITVTGPIRPGAAGPAGAAIASVESAPLYEIVEHTLAFSDNNAAEVLAHQVGLAVLHDPSFAGGARAVSQVLRGLGIRLAGTRILDGSGLSRKDRLTPDALLGVLRLAASSSQAALRSVITGLPVAGFTGSLQSRFDKGPAVAKGRVRAKTGTLTGVDALAGIATDLDGDRLVFVVIADRVPPQDTLAARAAIDRIAAALGACACAAGPAASGSATP